MNAGAEIPLRIAIANASIFSASIGDILILAGGLWNLGKDAAIPGTADNGGHPRFARDEDLHADIDAEVREVASAFDSLSEPWRSEALSRVFWRSLYATESDPEKYAAQHNRNVMKIIADAAAAWQAIGVPSISVFPFTLREDATTRGAEIVPIHTRDGVHPHRPVYQLSFRHMMSAIVQARAVPPPLPRRDRC